MVHAEEAAESGAGRLTRVANRDIIKAEETIDVNDYRRRFTEAMDDDFNTPQAIGALFDLAREINQAADEGKGYARAREMLIELARNILGLRLEADKKVAVSPELEILVNELRIKRDEYRTQNNWQKADEIRDKLLKMGVTLEDTPQGTKAIWKRRSK